MLENLENLKVPNANPLNEVADDNLINEKPKRKLSSGSLTSSSCNSASTSMLETDKEEMEMAPEDLWLILGFHRGLVVIYHVNYMI